MEDFVTFFIKESLNGVLAQPGGQMYKNRITVNTFEYLNYRDRQIDSASKRFP